MLLGHGGRPAHTPGKDGKATSWAARPKRVPAASRSLPRLKSFCSAARKPPPRRRPPPPPSPRPQLKVPHRSLLLPAVGRPPARCSSEASSPRWLLPACWMLPNGAPPLAAGGTSTATSDCVPAGNRRADAVPLVAAISGTAAGKGAGEAPEAPAGGGRRRQRRRAGPTTRPVAGL